MTTFAEYSNLCDTFLGMINGLVDTNRYQRRNSQEYAQIKQDEDEWDLFLPVADDRLRRIIFTAFLPWIEKIDNVGIRFKIRTSTVDKLQAGYNRVITGLMPENNNAIRQMSAGVGRDESDLRRLIQDARHAVNAAQTYHDKNVILHNLIQEIYNPNVTRPSTPW